jgi:hypothetical protein
MTDPSPESLIPFVELLGWLGGPFRCDVIAESIGLDDDACHRQSEIAQRLDHMEEGTGLPNVEGRPVPHASRGGVLAAADATRAAGPTTA